MVLGPKKSAMAVSSFKLSCLGIQFIFSVRQVPEIMTSVNTRNNGEFMLKMLNVGKATKMINQKLAMV